MVQSGRAGSSTGLALLRRQRRSPRSYSQNETSCLHNTACSSFASGEAKFRSFEDKFPGRVLTVRKTGGTMRIAQISPLMEAVPPKFYGGTERIVAYLTDALVGLGHEVTLFASGDSSTTATLVAGWPQALRLDPTIRDHIAPLITMLETAAQRAGEFDLVHLHCDYLGYVALRRAGGALPRHPTRPPRPAGAEAALPRVLRGAGGLYLGRSARSIARGALYRHRTPWPPRAAAAARQRGRRLSRFSRPGLARERAGPSDPERGSRPAAGGGP